MFERIRAKNKKSHAQDQSIPLCACACIGIESQIASRNVSEVIGTLNMPKVPSTAALWPETEVAAQQSVRVTTLKPFSQAVRIVLSTQQFVRNPPTTMVSIPCSIRSFSRFVPGNASK